MAKRPTYELHVKNIEQRSRHQKRVVFGGVDLVRFPDDFDGGYVKLLLAPPDADPLRTPHDDCKRRSFTVRAFDHNARTLTVDFAQHDSVGPATRWLQRVRVGDPVQVMGPGPVKRLDPTADWFLLAGDMTALPAITVNLEQLPDSATGHAFVEIPSDDDCQPLECPDGVRLHWIVNRAPGASPSPLVRAVTDMAWHHGRVSAWVACEFSVMRMLRSYLRLRQVDPADLYISSYWKWNATNEEHKAAKADDSRRMALV